MISTSVQSLGYILLRLLEFFNRSPIKKGKADRKKLTWTHRERKRKHAWSSVGAHVPRRPAKPWFPGDHVADEDCPHV